MNENIVQEILHELFSSFEDLETQSSAILQFLKHKGIANEKELPPFFEQARSASSVRWRAVRARIDYLLSSAMKTTEQDAKDAKKESQKTPEKSQEPSDTGAEVSGRKETEKETEKDGHDMPRTAGSGEQDANQNGASAEKDRDQQ